MQPLNITKQSGNTLTIIYFLAEKYFSSYFESLKPLPLYPW